ncbi:MAG: ABC transporter ATP-binding protein [Sporolactobacillus sp.]
MDEHVLEINNLAVSFHTHVGDVQAVRGINLFLKPGETLAIVGESGSGKSVTARSIMGLLPEKQSTIQRGSILFEGKDLTKIPEKAKRELRGKEIAMIFQDPMTSLNPTLTIGHQLMEPLRMHQKLSKKQAKQRSIELLRKVGIPNPEQRMKQYPHQFSGGMRQRVVIAIAIACNPKILIADEPTTALDVTVQAKILELLKNLQKQMGTAILFITHDLGVVANMADRIAVMYAGRVAEVGTVDEIFYYPQHPYTWGLLRSMPTLDLKDQELYAIPGSPPDLSHPPAGDAFASRNPDAMAIDFEEQPPFFQISPTHAAAAWRLDPRAPKMTPPPEIMQRFTTFRKIREDDSRHV